MGVGSVGGLQRANNTRRTEALGEWEGEGHWEHATAKHKWMSTMTHPAHEIDTTTPLSPTVRWRLLTSKTARCTRCLAQQPQPPSAICCTGAHSHTHLDQEPGALQLQDDSISLRGAVRHVVQGHL